MRNQLFKHTLILHEHEVIAQGGEGGNPKSKTLSSVSRKKNS